MFHEKRIFPFWHDAHSPRAGKIYYCYIKTLLVELKVATADTLRRTFSITTEGVTLGVTVVQNGLPVDWPFRSGLRVRACAGKRRDRRLR